MTGWVLGVYVGLVVGMAVAALLSMRARADDRALIEAQRRALVSDLEEDRVYADALYAEWKQAG